MRFMNDFLYVMTPFVTSTTPIDSISNCSFSKLLRSIAADAYSHPLIRDPQYWQFPTWPFTTLLFAPQPLQGMTFIFTF